MSHALDDRTQRSAVPLQRDPADRVDESLFTQLMRIYHEASDQRPEEWQNRALCAQTDPEAFFPEKGESTREAKRICAGCEVRAQCLDAALLGDERFGIWGGLSERERRPLRRARRDRDGEDQR